MEFVPQRLVLLKRGFIFAFAHVRYPNFENHLTYGKEEVVNLEKNGIMKENDLKSSIHSTISLLVQNILLIRNTRLNQNFVQKELVLEDY